MPIFVIYGDPPGDAHTLTTAGNALDLRKKGLLRGKLLKYFKARTWNVACQMYYNHNDWGKYNPPDFRG